MTKSADLDQLGSGSIRFAKADYIRFSMTRTNPLIINKRTEYFIFHIFYANCHHTIWHSNERLVGKHLVCSENCSRRLIIIIFYLFIYF